MASGQADMTDILDPTRSHTDQDDSGGEQEAVSSSPEAHDDPMQLSVGIDIGSASAQVVLSRVRLGRFPEELTGRFFVVGHERVYQSPVTLTPYLREEHIDAQAVSRMLDEAFKVADIHPDTVDAGVVTLTGAAQGADNTAAITEVLGDRGDKFLWVTAGHHMEAMLSAYGSGAALASRECGAPVLNIDIGGSTTKLTLVQGRDILHTATIAVGGRLAVLDGEARLTRLDPAGERLAALAGCTWSVGKTVREHDVERVTAWMADALVAVLTQNPAPPQIHGLWLTEPLPVPPRGTQGVMFSGGVSEYVYGREERDCGDLGRRFGRAIRQRLVAGRFPFPLLPVGEGIRATALGALIHSTQLSGSSAYLSRLDRLLPRRNLRVIQLPMVFDDVIDAEAVAAAIHRQWRRFDLKEGESEIALACRWSGAPSHRRLSAFAQGIVDAMPRTVAAAKAIFVMLDVDVAQTLGTILKDEIGISSDVLVLDGIVAWDFDYVDLGCVDSPFSAVPVTIKSLVFKHDPRVPVSAHGRDDGQPPA